MKKILTCLVLMSSLAFAQVPAEKAVLKDLKHPQQAVLWKIEGKDLKKPSFLFGTIHLPDPRITTLHPLAEDAFQQSDVICTEVDMSPENQMAIMPKMMRQDGKTLSSSVGAELMKELDTALQKINPALNAKPFDPMKTWVLALTLPLLEFQMSGKPPLDAVLYQRAATEGKERDSLETADSQLKIFDQFSEEEQVTMLKSTIRQIDEDKQAMQKMINIYLTGNASDLGSFIKEYMEKNKVSEDAELGERLMKLILDDRNKTMSVTMIKKLKDAPEKAHFFAVGAGHYTGETAIQNFLEKEGYTITPTFK